MTLDGYIHSSAIRNLSFDFLPDCKGFNFLDLNIDEYLSYWFLEQHVSIRYQENRSLSNNNIPEIGLTTTLLVSFHLIEELAKAFETFLK